MKKILLVLTMVTMLVISGCGKAGETVKDENMSKSETTVEPNDTQENIPTDIPKDIVEGAVTVSVDDSKEFQTIRGFGAGYTYYSNYAYYAIYKEEIYDLLFKDAHLSILRFKNAYQYDEEKDYDTKVEKDYYEAAVKRLTPLGITPEVLMSSWSPAIYFKDSECLYGTGTLAKDKNGEFVYDKHGKYWADLVDYYGDNGVPIDYISIQNEPDYEAAYESCTFDFIERDNAASYAKAFLAVYDATRNCKNPPKMIGPETMTCDSGDIGLMVSDILTEKPESLFGIAHHLYVGGDEKSAKSFNQNLRGLGMDYPDIEKWMTEYYRGDFIFTAQMIQNSMIFENLNAYIFWGGTWMGPVGKEMDNLIGVDSSVEEEGWDHEHGYVIGEKYYAMRHFSEFILPGYKRVNVILDNEGAKANDDDIITTDDVSCSAYVSPDKKKLVLVAINDMDKEQNYQFVLGEHKNGTSRIITSDYSKGTDTEVEELYKDAGSLDEKGCYVLPAHSISTIVIE